MSRSPPLSFGKSSLFRAIAADAKLPLPGQPWLSENVSSASFPTEPSPRDGSTGATFETTMRPPCTVQQIMDADMKPAPVLPAENAIALNSNAQATDIPDNTEAMEPGVADVDREPARHAIVSAPTDAKPQAAGVGGAEKGSSPTRPAPSRTSADTAANPSFSPDKPHRSEFGTSTGERTVQAGQPAILSGAAAEVASSQTSRQTHGASSPSTAQAEGVTSRNSHLTPDSSSFISDRQAHEVSAVPSTSPQAQTSAPEDPTHSISRAIVSNVLSGSNRPFKDHPHSVSTAPAKAFAQPQSHSKPEMPKVHIGSLEVRIEAPQPAPEIKKTAPVSFSGSSIASRRYLRSW